MSSLTEKGALAEAAAGNVTGSESRLAGAGYVKRLYKDVQDGVVTVPSGVSRLSARGALLAEIQAGMGGGLSPSKVFDFTAGSLPSGVTFTRAGSRNFFNSSGVLASATTNTPCFEYDNNLACLGLSVNDAATNICLRSNAFSTLWSNYNAMPLTSGITGPDGGASAWRLIPAVAAGNQRINQTITLSIGQRYCYSLYIKADAYTRVKLNAGSTSIGMEMFCKLDSEPNFRTKTGADFTDVSGGYEAIGNTGWYRFWVTGVAAVTGGTYSIYVANSSDAINYSGNGTDGILIYGAQCEIGSKPSAYIDTAGTSASTVADYARNTDISWLDTSKGTFVVETYDKGGIVLGSGANTLFSAATTPKAYNKIAYAWGGSTSDLVANGGSTTAGGLPTFASDIVFCGTSASRSNARIRKVSYYSQRLSVAQMQTLTSHTPPAASVGAWRVAALRNKLPNQTQTLSGSTLYFYSRFKYVVGSGDLTKIKLSFSNFYAYTDTVGNAVYIDDVALERETGSATTPVYFSAGRTLTLADGDVDIKSDEILPSVFGLSTFARGDVLWVKVRGHVNTSGHKIPVGRSYAENGSTFAAYYSPGSTTLSSTDTFGPYTWGGTAPTIMNFGFSPVMIGVYSGVDPYTYFGIGSSVFNGTAGNNGGYFQEAMTDVGGVNNPLSSIECALGGTTQTQWAGGTKWKTYIAYARIAVSEVGFNELNSALHKHQDLTYYFKNGGAQIILRPALITNTSSTDSWATEANQTKVAESNFVANNAFFAEQAANGFVGGYSFMSSVRGTDAYKWLTNGSANYMTTDGSHPSAAGYTALAADLRTLMATVTLATT